jgi:exodeoxyribonuclease-3
MTKIASWNVNSINAHLDQVTSWIKQNDPDVLLLQETKCEDSNFPYLALEQFGISHLGQKSYNGVAILSKHHLENISETFENNPCPEQARFIQADFACPIGMLKVINVYVPNGGEVGSEKFAIKLEFLKHLLIYLRTLDSNTPTILAGDFNVAPFDIDVYSPEQAYGGLLFSDIEKKLMRAIINANFFDTYRLLNPYAQEFSWWDYRGKGFETNAGMRIDFLLANAKCASLLCGAGIDSQIRKHPKCSDHAPAWIALDLKKP